MIHPDRPFVGRALTAAYLPGRPDLVDHVARIGKEEARIGPSNSWPIDMLQLGDVYVADGCGKIADGTLIGDNLGNAIYAKTIRASSSTPGHATSTVSSKSRDSTPSSAAGTHRS